MRELFIPRHSKALEHSEDGSDFSRCLAPRGVEKADRISQALSRQVQRPDLILSSPACRALETAGIFATALEYPQEQIRTYEQLYHFGGIDYALAILRGLEPEVQRTMIVGHNPTFTALAWHLCADFRQDLSTSAIVGLQFQTDHWMDISAENSTLNVFLNAKHLRSM